MWKPFSSNSFYFIERKSFTENHKFSNKNNYLPAWRKIENILFAICTWPNSPVRAKILSRFQFKGKNDVWISQVRDVLICQFRHGGIKKWQWQQLRRSFSEEFCFFQNQQIWVAKCPPAPSSAGSANPAFRVFVLT